MNKEATIMESKKTKDVEPDTLKALIPLIHLKSS